MLRRHININTFVITTGQIARMLGIDPRRIVKWRKWRNVLWVHIEGRGGYFVSYRRLEQWITACSALIRRCRTKKVLEKLWALIEKEQERYSEINFQRLKAMEEERLVSLTS